MLQKFFGTFALFVLLLGPASQAMADERDILEENLPEVLAKLRENQLFYRDSMAVLVRLDGVEYEIRGWYCHRCHDSLRL